MRKEDGIDFEDWYEEYCDYMSGFGLSPELEERVMAERLYEKNWTAAKAGAENLDFMMNG